MNTFKEFNCQETKLYKDGLTMFPHMATTRIKNQK